MKIHFIAQSGFIIEQNGKKIGIDIWLDNPINPKKLEDTPKLDYVFLTHDHKDHGMMDMLKIAKRDKAKYIANATVINYLSEEHNLENGDGGHMGGEFSIDENLKVFITNAIHSSDTGMPTGFIITFFDKTIYHTGDTAYFSDMSFYSELYEIDLMILPIGGRYTMGTKEAIYALNAVQPKKAIPCHYNTSPRIQADPNELMTSNTEILIMNPGDKTEV